MTATSNFRLSVVQGLSAVFIVSCAAGLLGYFQAERQIAEWSSSAASTSPTEAPPSKPAFGRADTVSIGAGNEPTKARSYAGREQSSGSVSRGSNGLPPADTSLAPAWPLWEFKSKEPVPPREPPLTPLNWRLIGAAQSGQIWQVVILKEGSPRPEFFRVGETLPGGYLIEAISEEDVTLVHRRRRMIVAYIGS